MSTQIVYIASARLIGYLDSFIRITSFLSDDHNVVNIFIDSIRMIAPISKDNIPYFNF